MRNGFIREHLINSLAVDGVYFGIVAGTLSIKILSLDCSSSSLTNCASNGPQILAKLLLGSCLAIARVTLKTLLCNESR